MRRIDTNDVWRASPQPNEGAGLGPVSVQHIGIELADQACELRPYPDIGGTGVAADGDAMRAQFEPRRDLLQRGRCTFAAGQAVGKDTDMMAAVGLSIGKVEDMAKNSADRRTYRVKDPKRLVGGGRHVQNQSLPQRARSPMVPVTLAAGMGSSTITGNDETVARVARMGQP